MALDRVMSSEAPRIGYARSVGELVDRAGQGAWKRFGFQQSAIVRRWAEIVGETYARHARPEALRFPAGKREGGTLELRVTGAMAPRLQMIEPEIIERVNRFYGHRAVAKLRLLHGLVPVPEAAKAEEAMPEVPAGLAPSLKAVSDPALRASLEALARRLSTAAGPPDFD